MEDAFFIEMSIFKVKLRKTDRLFTKYIRILFNFTCQKCGRYYPPDGNLLNLGVSHFHGRDHESTRFEVDNATLLCNIPCHRDWEHEKKEGREYYNYMLKRLGKERLDSLYVQAHTLQKRDDKMDILIINEMLKELE